MLVSEIFAVGVSPRNRGHDNDGWRRPWRRVWDRRGHCWRWER